MGVVLLKGWTLYYILSYRLDMLGDHVSPCWPFISVEEELHAGQTPARARFPETHIV